MKTSLNKTELQTGDILHCTGKKLLSKAIMKMTGQNVSHTAAVISVWGRLMIVDAQKDGFNIRPLDYWLSKYNYSITVSRNTLLNEEAKRMWSGRILRKVGSTPYDFESLILRHPWKIITGKWKHRTKEDKRMVCSEVIAWSIGVPTFYNRTPADILELTREIDYYHNFKLKY